MRKGWGPPTMIPTDYPLHYGHFMEQYWARPGPSGNIMQEYYHDEKHEHFESTKQETYDYGNVQMGNSEEIKTENFENPTARTFKRTAYEAFNRPTPPKVETIKAKVEMKCQFCASYFDDLSNLLGHLHLHLERMPSKDIDLACMVKDCDYKADSELYQDEESDPRPISKYAQLRSIEQHIRSVHLNMQTWKCDYCDKQFNQKQSLVYHHKMHNDPTKEYCNICERFKDAEKMSLHDADKCARLAMVERKHECNDCGKTFKSLPSLWLHKKIHSDERFICEFCNKAFTQKGNRKTHMMKKHVSKILENPDCFNK